MLPADKTRLISQINAAKEAVEKASGVARSLAQRLDLPLPETIDEARTIGRAAERAAVAPPLHGVAVSSEAWKRGEQTLRAAINSGRRFSQIRADHVNQIGSEAWNVPVGEERENLAQYGKKWWRFVVPKYRRSLKKLRSLCTGKLPRSLDGKLVLADAILESQSKLRELVEVKALCQAVFGMQWKGIRSNWDQLQTILEWVLALRLQVNTGQLPPGIMKFLEVHQTFQGLAEEATEVSDNCAASEARLGHLLEVLLAEGELLKLPALRFSEQISKLNVWLQDIASLQNLVAFNLLRNEAKEQGIYHVAYIATDWEVAGKRLVEAFEHAWYSGVLEEAFRSRPALSRFDRQNHEAAINAFRELDRYMLNYNRAKVSLKHWVGVPRHTARGSLGSLLREFARKRGHKPIRKIMSESGDAIQAIKPVFMMSPLSVAMYLPPEGPRFDLVIFDEASQIKPSDAFGAVLRAKQAIVVGDSKQLPPTSFFDKLTQIEDSSEEEEDVEVNVTRDMESILALMGSKIATSNTRRRDLRWHYRSIHDSLIATSNRLFYDDRLFVFPSADRQRKELGLVFHHLPNTVYGRGGSKKNPEEARVVAQAVVRHVKESRHLTLGVAAFSISQEEAIQDELDKLSTLNPSIAAALEEFDRQHPYEPLFVKNLETVQGDERDVIFISVGYGKDADRRVSMNFGPLNKLGGERRLNVLITRARMRCEVLTNLRSTDIRHGEGGGVAALRTFLHFAETGELDMPSPTGQEPMSPFEEAVIEEICAHGIRVTPQVGSAGFSVDIGICDPENPEKFVLGIECDSRKYHSARAARDRDRLRQDVLERRGWRIHRIWGTDWWQNRERELRRTLEVISQAIAARGSPARLESQTDSPIEIRRDAAAPARPARKQKVYVFATPSIYLRGRELRDISAREMSEWVLQVVEVESPVHFEEVVRRIREAARLERAGDPIKRAIRKGIRAAVRETKLPFRTDFCGKYRFGRPKSAIDPSFPAL